MIQTLQRYGKVLVAIFFCLLLLIGLLTVPDYGSYWDERSEVGILRMSLVEYAQLFSLESDALQTLLQAGVIPISQSVERDHGICAYYPLFGALLNPSLSTRAFSLLWRGYTWLLFMLGAWSLYAIARAMGFSRGMGCIAVLLLVLSPRFFAEGHYNNKDIVLMSLVLLVLWQTIRLSVKPSFPRAFWFALAAGFCCGTRIIGMAVCLCCGLMVLLRLVYLGRLNRRVVGIGGFTLLLSVLFYMALTPAMLSAPVNFFEHLLKNAVGFSRWHGTILFDGALVQTASEKVPALYLPIMIALTTPLWALMLLLIGLCAFIVRAARERMRLLQTTDGFMLTLVFILFLVPLCFAVFSRMLVYNGWRHFYFLQGSMALLMLYGWHQLWGLAKRIRYGKHIAAGLLAGALVFTGIGIWRNHPYQYGFYNALLPREKLETRYELDYWNLSLTNALRTLVAQSDGKPLLVTPSDPKTRSGVNNAIDLLTLDTITVLRQAPQSGADTYVISNVMYAVIHEYQPPEGYEPIMTIYAYGVPMTILYAAPSI